MTIIEKIQMDWDLFIRAVNDFSIVGKVFMGPLLFFLVVVFCVLDILFKKRENW